MGKPAKRIATYDDVINAPDDKIAEIIEGELVLTPRPATLHSVAIGELLQELGPPFSRGRGGPGGWIILPEPELHLDGHVLVPDVAGWRRETMGTVPRDPPYLTIRPDWVCEVLSPSTERWDRGAKVRLYAQAGVGNAWLVNPLSRTLEVLRLSTDAPSRWASMGVFTEDAKVRAEPFEVFELGLDALWRDVQL